MDDEEETRRLRSGRRVTRVNDRDTNPPPPGESEFFTSGTDESLLRSGRRLSRTNDRDTNPPPPGESDPFSPGTDESQLSQSLLSVDTTGFTTIARTHDGHGTTSPRDAVIHPIVPTAVPTLNNFDALAPDDDDSLDHHDDDAEQTRVIDNIFREADATLAAETYDFVLLEERLRLRLDRDLSARVDRSTSAIRRDIMLIDERITRMADHLQLDNSSFTAAITTISANTAKLAQETSALSVRVVDHQAHLENLLGFEEARRKQMDDHVTRMGELAALIADVGSQATVQTQRVSAQLDGLRSTMDANHATTKTDIIDLRGRIVPDLRDHSNAIAADVKCLEDRIGSFDAIAADVKSLEDRIGSFNATTLGMSVTDIADRLDAFRAEFDAYTNHPARATAPPATIDDIVGADDPPRFNPRHAHVDPSSTRIANPATIDDSAVADGNPRVNPLFPNVDPSTLRSTTAWYANQTPHDGSGPRLHPIDTSPSDDDAGLLRGGPITSPRATDKERQARRLHISRHDIAGLASPAYHGGRTGVSDLSLGFIHACGYQTFSPEIDDDVLPCYGTIQLLHRKVTAAWTNPRTQQSGPSVERILEKGLTVFPKLRGTTAREAVSFYESLQQVSTSYLMPIMPFDTICLANNYEGLFPPGLGTDAYCECCIAMLEVLPRLIPINDYEVGAKLSVVRNSSRNGYDLLWRVLELFVPGFDPTVPIAQPVWQSESTILDFCQGHMLYFRLQAKKNMYFSSRDRTTIFLRAVTPSEYADVVTSLQTSVDAYRHPDNDGILPDHLRLDGIATLIHNNAKQRVRDIHSPRIHRVAGMGTIWDASTEDESPYCHVQGFRPQAFRMDGIRPSDGFRQRGDDGFRQRGDDYPRQRGGSDGRYGSRPPRSSPDKPQGRFARPDQRRRAYKPGVQCDACKRPGHEAASCDMLAIALYIDRYTKDISDSERSAIETRWLDRWKSKLGQPARTPRQVMRTFCDNYNITPDHLDCALDWDCWPDCDPTDSDNE